MLRVDEVVIRIVPRIQGANAIEFAKQNGIQQMVHCVGIVGMALQDLPELLDRALIVHVIKILKCGGVKRIGRPEGELLLSPAGGRNEQQNKSSKNGESRNAKHRRQSLPEVYLRSALAALNAAFCASLHDAA